VDELNRDLLVAVLALLTDAIPRHALSVALSDWARERHLSLPQLLLRDGSIDRDRLQALHCLADSHFARHQNDVRACLDAWNAQELTEEILTEIGESSLRTTLGVAIGLDATLPADGAANGVGETIALPGTDAPDPGVAGAATVGERFRPIRPHARGGIGQVWVARDSELQRDVALKVIQDRFAERSDQRARFILEAEITGNLEHPGIVPVYSLGRNAAGRPYYAMRFIRGESLASAIRQFHLRWPAREGRGLGSGSMWGVEFRELIGRFLDVCDAIEYAHSRGVLHRDLKPANIMLGRYGETLVVDWGLAKVIGKPDILPMMAGGDAEPNLAASGTRSHAGETQPGTTIGTPSYMSPEQARGDLDEMGPSSDVYSLGATLYELLTGRVAFRGEKTAEVLERVVKGDFRPPRAVLRSVPAPLDAICLKAMALERRQRYDTVRELARDIRHWLADETVVAYTEGRLERLGRWLRRHRTWTYAAAAALVGITVAATVGVFVVEQGRRREAEARSLAVTNYNLAKKAVDEYFTRVSEDTLLNEQNSVDMRRLRGGLLKTALGFYREFLRERGSDPELRRELAEAQFRVGRIMREIGTSEETIAAFNASIDIWEELHAAAPSDPELRAHLARSYLALGEQFAHIPDFPRAFTALARSQEILQGLAAEDPSEPSYSVKLAECEKLLGIAEGQGGEPDLGLERLRQAEAILKSLLERTPGDPGYRKRLADTIIAQGFIHERTGKYPDALREFRESQGYYQSLLDEHRSGPKPIELLDSLALSYFNVGTILFKLERRDSEKWLAMFEKSLEHWQALANAHPSVNDFHAKVAWVLGEIADLRHKADRHEQAFPAIRRSIEILESLVASQPDQPRYHAMLGRAFWILGFLHDEDNDNAQALPALLRARDEEDRAVGDSPESEQYRGDLAGILWNLGEQYVDLGRVADGLPHYRRSVEIKRQLLAVRPQDRVRILDLAGQLAMLATVERHGGDSATARQSYGEAAALLEPLDPERGDPDVQVPRAEYLIGEAVSAADRGLKAQSLPLLDKAVEILTPLVDSARGDPSPRQRLTEALWHRARLLRSSRGSGESDPLDDEGKALWKGRKAGELADLAMKETTEAARVGYGRVPLEPAAEQVRHLELDLAASLLRLAIEGGFRDFDALRKKPESWLLLSRPDIGPILDDLEFPDDPFPPPPASR
jgi:serine/threonine protein kinase